MPSHPIMPCIWSDNQGKEMAEKYVSLFKGSTMQISSSMMYAFSLSGRTLTILNGGPQFRPDASISFMVVIDNKDDINLAWNGLADGGKVMMPMDNYPWSEWYGWVQDKYGVHWQLFLGSPIEVGSAVLPNLMFTGQKAGRAEEAITYYTEIFPSSSIQFLSRYAEADNDVTGYVNHGRFQLLGAPFVAMDSSEMHGVDFSEGLSFIITCDTQQEIDTYWEKLTAGGEEQMCGWLKDRYGVSWQVVPSVLPKLLSDPDKSAGVIQAFMSMKKFDIAALESA